MKYFIVLILIVYSVHSASQEKVSCDQKAEQLGGVKHYLNDNDFVVSFVHTAGNFMPTMRFCPHDNDPARCDNATIWFSIDELVNFKALGKDVICSHLNRRSYEYAKQASEDANTRYTPRKTETTIVYYTKK